MRAWASDSGDCCAAAKSSVARSSNRTASRARSNRRSVLPRLNRAMGKNTLCCCASQIVSARSYHGSACAHWSRATSASAIFEQVTAISM
ncbi:MAG: hypothetical protein U0168_03535 [Nannocystaceae bacterium]